MNSFDYLVKELEAKSHMEKQEILGHIDNKYNEMESLITKEGAVYLVAKELGINLMGEYKMQIKDVALGMKNVGITGRIFKISKINEFQKSGRKGRVSNVFLGDSTGIIRIPLWDDQVKLVEDGLVTVGDIVKIGNGFVRENMFGDKEISLGKYGSINHVQEFVALPSVEELSNMLANPMPERTRISDLVSSGIFEIRGSIVQLFKGNYLFNICPVCENKMADKCVEHGGVPPNHAMIVSFVIDDGTSDIRCVLFRETAERFLQISSESLAELNPDQRFEMIKDKVLGREMLFRGRVKKNKIFDNLEMTVNEFEDINALEESKRLINEIEIMQGG